ncbi:aminopeptidase [Phascolomyces articulosus]|uniref:Peptide hydrolase n=1 Tax=Phascolomyces articulosus TaxID=60185 RepID=A0AAD5PCH9_9FUNG|nr:aminopeptidase [Phascolomyces articulosus]
MRVLPAIASALALLSVSSAAPLEERGPPAHALSKQLVTRVKLDGLLRHTNAFQKQADEGGNKNRVFGSKAHNATIDYIYNFGVQNGYETTIQYGTFPYSETIASSVSIVSPEVETPNVPINLMTFSPSTPEEGVTADVVNTGNLGCAATDYTDVTGKIALVQRGTCAFGDKAAAAGEAGAAGLLIYNTEDGELNGTLGSILEGAAPTGGISKADGEALIKLLEGGSAVSLNLKLIEIHENRGSANVCAETKSGNKQNVVMLGAHTDSVVAGPGINDNGSGSAGLLEVSYLFRNVKPNNAVRFCWWTAEEFGLLGAEHYVASLSEEQINDIALYLNFDMIASPNYFNGIYDGDGSAFETAGPEGSAAIEKLLIDFFAGQDAKSSPTAFDGRSDYGPFIDVGIPAGGTFTGAEGLKTEQEASWYGGKAGIAYDECYHAACDTTENLNSEAFVLHTKAIAHATAIYSDSTETVNGVASGRPGKGHGNRGKAKFTANRGTRAPCGSTPPSVQ